MILSSARRSRRRNCDGPPFCATPTVPPVEALMCCPRYPMRILIAALISALVASAQPRAAAESDPHRPACVDAQCRKIMSFLKAHYCSESPYGNGREDGCQITIPKGPRPGVDVVADFECEWSDAKRAMDCKQHGEPSSYIRSVLTRELRRLGLPAKANGQTYFTAWKSTASGWSLAAAYYVRTADSNVELCQVIVVIDQSSHVLMLRKLPFAFPRPRDALGRVFRPAPLSRAFPGVAVF